MLNLDNLRKQAKQILRWHRDRHYTVAAEIRATLPRFEKLSDLQVLDAPFKLADAQELVARRQGFENWQALKAGALTMSIIKQPTTTTKPVISATEAVVYVTDFDRALDYYASKLGFAVEFTYGDPPFYGLVARDQARLCLRLVCEPVFVGDVREREQLLSAALTLNTAGELKALFQAFRATGVDFLQNLKTEPWGTRTFIIRDPDGNLVLFAAPQP